MVQQSERWRQWLEDAAVPAPTSTDTRRKLRRPTASASTAATAARPAGKGPSPRVLIGGAAAIAAITLVGVVIGVASRSGGSTDSAHPYKIVTTEPAASGASTAPATTNAPPAFCTPGRVGGALVSNTGGDRATGEGAIAEYEFRYFGRRDPNAVMDLTDNGPGVPAAAQVADGIAQIPADAAWCVSITPAGQPDRFETSVRYQPKGASAPVSWLMVITVAPGDGGYRVTRIEDKPA